MDKKYTALFLTVLLVAAEANSVASRVALVPPRLARAPGHVAPLAVEAVDPSVWDGLGLNADVNHYVDTTIPMLLPLMRAYGLDPMDLPDVEEGFSVRPILITYSAWLRIHNGYMSGLMNIERSGDQMVNYFAKMLRLRLQFQFNDLEFVYRYLVKVMQIGPTGGIVGSLNRFKVVLDILIDFNNDEIHLQQFSLTDIGRLRVRLTGNILTDWLVNPVIGVFVMIFDTIIIKVVEITIRNAVHDSIEVINRNIKDILDNIESMNVQ